METRIVKVKRCFQEMDLNGLKKILTEFDTFFQTSRRIFFIKLEEVFNKFKDKGETYLYIFPGIGIDEKGKKQPAYQFIGNNFRNYFEVIIIGWVNDSLRIEVCKEIEVKLGDHSTFSIDEYKKLPDFQYIELLEEFQKGDLAFQELKELQKGVNHLSVYLDWITKHTPLFEKHLDFEGDNNSKYYHFFKSFLKLRKLKYLNLDLFTFVAERGYREFKETDTSKNLEILTWLARYEEVSIWFISYYDTTVESNLEKGFFEFEGCKIHLEKLNEALKFIHYFSHYNRYKSHEIYNMGIKYNQEITDYYSSENRGFYGIALKRMGISVDPIKINTEEEPIESYFIKKALNR